MLTSVKRNAAAAPTATPDVTYVFQYDALLRPTSTIVGTGTTDDTRSILATNSYILSGINEGQLSHTTYGNDFRVAYTYDAFNRVIETRQGIGTSLSLRYSYAYNAAGRLAWLRDHLLDQITETEYDESGRPCRIRTHENGTHVSTREVAYDSTTGLLSTFRAYIGTAYTPMTTTYGYDAENRLTTTTFGASTSRSTVTYDALGRVSRRKLRTDGTDYETNYWYANGGYGTGSTTPLVGTISQSGETFHYSYDDNGNITAANRGDHHTSYVYNTTGELVRVNDEDDPRGGSTGTTWVYAYDYGGNILTRKRYAYSTAAVSTLGDPQETTTFTYGTSYWKDQLTAVNGTTITYDKIGNPLTDGTWTYTWQNGRQLASMTNGSTTASFVYNSDGLRIRKTVGSTVVNYTLHGTSIVHMTHGTTNLHFFYDSENRPAIVIYGGNRYGYVKNLQGDVLGLINDSGTEVVRYVYDAWGKLLATTGSMATTLGRIQPFRYRGYVYDEETGLYYLRSRYYNPEWGRFLSADALIKGNLYCYCNSDPIRYTDDNGYSLRDFLKRLGIFDFTDGTSTGKVYYVDFTTALNSSLFHGGLMNNGVTIRSATPNPYGKVGGLEHQHTVSTVRDIAESSGVAEDGYSIRGEYRIDTPGGYKSSRYSDVALVNETENQYIFIQVGRMNLDGSPVARERRAIEDIQDYGLLTIFIPYRNNSPTFIK